MSLRWFLVVFSALILAGCDSTSTEEGFAGLGQSEGTDGFTQPGPDTGLTFPDDYGAHPDHRIEWWYLTANLETDSGEPVGVQWTQFRQSLVPPSEQSARAPEDWPLQAVWMAHSALSFQGQHRFAERLARGGVGQGGVQLEPFAVWLDHWQLEAAGPPDTWRLSVQAGNDQPWGYDLTLRIARPPVAHGANGFSAKSESGQGSMYFSLVDIQIDGEITLNGQTYPVQGKGWFDREWSSQFLKAGQQGWDWFALHLDSGDKLMAFRLRDDQGGYQAGTWIPAVGEPVPLGQQDFALEPLDRSGEVPVRWRLRLPAQSLDIQVTAPTGDYFNNGLFPYWESPVRVDGSHTGVGYMELTGYASP
ncbi:MAG: carotenoid 1,2-hydratase [Marinobacter sp. 34-60-7]|nr:MAG: carotenoid 1,2-hydratase [Marinobacter sp. 34-60-7]